jgi:PleD family two-component response regulator
MPNFSNGKFLNIEININIGGNLSESGIKIKEMEMISKLSVLIINDEEFISEMIENQLNLIGIRKIEKALNGYDGFNTVISKAFDLVICDINMPVMNGFQFC